MTFVERFSARSITNRAVFYVAVCLSAGWSGSVSKVAELCGIGTQRRRSVFVVDGRAPAPSCLPNRPATNGHRRNSSGPITRIYWLRVFNDD